MKRFARALTMGSLSLSALALTPAVASAATVTSQEHAHCFPVSISTYTEGNHLYITITTPAGSITIDPPIVMR